VQDEHAVLTFVGIAPQAPSGARCGNSALEYNGVVREAVAHELEHAREQLGYGAELELLVEGSDPPLEEFAAAADFDVILLPARHRPLRSAKHPAAAILRRLTHAEIQIVDSRGVVADRS
jgi:hypothetical protein